MLKRFVLFLIFIIPIATNAQIGVGQWREHLPYSHATYILQADNEIYVATEYALFIYTKEDNSFRKLSKINGLSEVEITHIAYSSLENTIVVAYANGNVDLISENQIFNISDIKQKKLYGSKRINHIFIQDNLAYLATDFGIVVLNIARQEIIDTYFIGEDAAFRQITDLCSHGENLYAATPQGLYYASMNDFLPNYSNWHFVDNSSFLDKSITSVESHNKLYISLSEDSSLYEYTTNSLVEIEKYESAIIHLKVVDEYLFIIEKNKINQYDNTMNKVQIVNENQQFGLDAKDVFIDKDQDIWIADNSAGLVYYSNNRVDWYYYPNSPYYNHVSDIEVKNGKVWVAGGGQNLVGSNLWRYAELNYFEAQNWTTSIAWNSDARDLIHIAIDPYNENHIFGSTLGSGIAEFQDSKLVNLYNSFNSSLQAVENTDDYVLTGGLTFDSSGNLWVSNSASKLAISVRSVAGEWLAYDFPELRNYSRLGKIITTSHNHKWLQIPNGGGIFVFDDKNTIADRSDDESKKLSLLNADNTLITNFVFDIAEDKEGTIWIGTDKGVLSYYYPESIFENDAFFVDQVKIVDGENVQYLLSEATVTAIAVDGANRKWFGTENSGVYLMSASCTEELLHFSTQNSPLLSDNIQTIGIDQTTGEVYFGTEKGIISYRSNATESDYKFSEIIVFPNPVYSDYEGIVSITGLAENAEIKIVDIQGRLVFETTALGGQATWDLSLAAYRPQSGVYYVFALNEYGDRTGMTKILFQN